MLADIAYVLSDGDKDVVQSTQPVTLYLTITVRANMSSPIFPDNPPEMPTKGEGTPAEETTNPFMVPDSAGPIQSSAPEPLLPSSDSPSVKTGTPMSDGQAEMSPTGKALIALHRVDEAKKPIDRVNTWKGVVRRIKWVTDTLSPIAEVRAIIFCFSSTEPTFAVSSTRLRRWPMAWFRPSQRCNCLRYC